MKQCKQIIRKNKHLRDLLCIKVNENNFVDSFFFPLYLLLFPSFFFLCVFLSSKPFQNNQMHCQITDHYFNMFFVEMQVKKKLKSVFWAPEFGCPNRYTSLPNDLNTSLVGVLLTLFKRMRHC